MDPSTGDFDAIMLIRFESVGSSIGDTDIMIEESPTASMRFNKPFLFQVPDVLIDGLLISNFIDKFVSFTKNYSSILPIKSI
ncbi:hypothetical protein BRD00_01325 [Halobacteriales archaeon QS_8_69_26]|nr:MAG: hypothetical protein BRD00_01325 [Halobacteriales archaeon QS_8_69_26]